MAEEEQYKNAVGLMTTTIQALGEGGVGASAEGVPPDHLRYVRFIKYHNLGPYSIVTVYENRGGTLQLKDQQGLTQYDTVQIPERGPGDKPVMVFQGSSTVSVQTSNFQGNTSSLVLVHYEFLDKPGGG